MTDQAPVVIQGRWEEAIPDSPIPLLIERHSIVKRRWRKVATNGRELAYQLQSPTAHGEHLLGSDGQCYVVQQQRELVIEIPMPQDYAMATKLGWYLGNQHLGIEVRKDSILLEDIHTLRRSLDKIGIPYQQKNDVFLCSLHSSHTH